MSSEVNISDPAVRAELDKLDKLDGGVPFRASTQHAHHTWARTFHSSPELYIQPESLEEIEKAITLARRCRKRITTVGCGHSPSDLTCTSSWMMNLDKFNKILDVNKEAGLVTMQGGIRLYQLGAELDKLGLAMPNLGSINGQSIAGAISTGTHGSTLRHSILSSSVTSLKITLANSRTLSCSADENEELFRAALCSLGALGVVTEITFQAVPAFNLHWSQTVYPDSHMLNNWDKDLWTQAEFVRCWWFPYTRRSTVWKASKTDDLPNKMPYKPSYYDTKFGYTIYHNLLYLAQYVPRILPWVEWFVFGMQYGFSTGPKTTQEAIQPSREALLMNCLYSQYVNEWALPLKEGPIALRRLSSWLNHLKPSDPDYVEHGIPFSSDGLWVHAPVEVRVSDTTVALKNQDGTPRKSVRPYLDNTCNDGPTLYLNATLYRPYNMDPPCRVRYYQGFEYLMRELGGKPHWAKNFETTGEQFEEMYGDDLQAFRRVRDEADPEGLFTGPWHRRYLLRDTKPRLELEEVESTRKPLPSGGIEVFGALPVKTEVTDDADYVKKPVFDEAKRVAEVKEEAAKAKLAVSKALEDSENLRMRLQKKVEEKLAREAAEKARLQAIEDDKTEQARLQQIADDKAASDAAAAEKARLQKIADDKSAADAASEKARLQKIADELEQKRIADEAAEAKRLQDIEDRRIADELKQKRIADEAAESARLQKIEDDRIAEEKRIADEKAEAARLQAIEDEKAEKARLQKITDDEAAAALAKEQEELRLQKEKEESDRRAAELLKKQEEEAASIESERLQKLEDERIQREKEESAHLAATAKKEQEDREAAELAEQQRTQREKEEKEESARLAAIAKKEDEERSMRESEARRNEQERALNERREKEARRLAEERAQKERVVAERRKIAEEERLAAIEKRRRDDEHNAKLAAAEAQRLKEEAAERHALRQQQLKEAAEAREREEYEKKMVAEHDRRQAAKAEALLRERDERDRIARVQHDNEVRLEKGRLAREAKQLEELAERERLAEDARQIQKRHEVEEKRRKIQEKKELQRIEIQKKQAERRELAAQKKAAEDNAAKHSQELRAIQQKQEAEEKAKKAAEIREAFKAQIAARAALAAAELEKQKQRSETPPKAQNSPSPQPSGTSATPAAQINGAPSTPAAKIEEHKPTTFADAVKEDLSHETPGQSPKSSSGDKKIENSRQQTSPKAQKIFRPPLGNPTPSVLLAKREGLETDGSPAQKRIKLEEVEEPAVLKKKVEEKAWKPQLRPNSLDELLAEQERGREQVEE